MAVAETSVFWNSLLQAKQRLISTELTPENSRTLDTSPQARPLRPKRRYRKDWCPRCGRSGRAGFGNSGTRIVDGPGQANLDLARSKTVALKWPMETAALQIRSEFYNALNHPQFSDPDNNFSSSTFGVITSTSVNPRIIQLALRFSF